MSKRETPLEKVDIRRLIPVRRDIVKVEFDDRPQSICHKGAISVAQEPVCVSDQCC